MQTVDRYVMKNACKSVFTKTVNIQTPAESSKFDHLDDEALFTAVDCFMEFCRDRQIEKEREKKRRRTKERN